MESLYQNKADEGPEESVKRDMRLLGITTMLERFIFHAVRSILILYCINELCFDKSYSYHVVAAFMALSFTSPIFGGFLADKVFGYSKSLLIGSGIIVLASICCLLLSDTIFIGLALLCVGSGFLKSNVTSLFSVISHNTQKNVFSYYFMMLNVGAFAAPILCATVGELFGWVYCFMILVGSSLLCFMSSLMVHRQHHSDTNPPLGNKPFFAYLLTAASVLFIYWLMQNKSLTDSFMLVCIGFVLLSFAYYTYKNLSDLTAILIIVVMIAFNTLYWALYEQVGSTVNVFTAEYVNRDLAGMLIPVTFFQCVSSFFVIALTPIMSSIWSTLDRRQLPLSSYNKFGIGLIITGISYFILYSVITPGLESSLIGLPVLIVFYLVLTVGELCVAPVGLSIISSITPKSIKAMMMGVWQFSAALSNWVVGLLAIQFVSDGTDSLTGFRNLFYELIVMGVASGILMIGLFTLLQKKLKGITVR